MRKLLMFLIAGGGGFPPSAADRDNRYFDNPIRPSDCTEVDAFAPDARPDGKLGCGRGVSKQKDRPKAALP